MKKIKQAVKLCVPGSLIIQKLKKSSMNSVLLTFDDGPDDTITPLILERLETYGVRAIFFVVGRRAAKHPHLMRQINANGHLIGNHTFDHPNDKPYPYHQYKRDLAKCQKTVYGIIGTKPTFFRPPRGLITLASLLATRHLALKITRWSVFGHEWDDAEKDEAETIGERLSGLIKPRDIVCLHDDNTKVPEILDFILPVLKFKNFDLYNGVNHLC